MCSLPAFLPVKMGQGGRWILGEDGIAEERGGKEYLDGFQIGHTVVHDGGEEGPKPVCHEADIDVRIGLDDFLEGE
jgi:hypothetical protein